MKYILYLLIIYIGLVISQDSPSNCTFNGIDYSFLYLNDTYYTAYSENNKHKFIFNICGETKECHRGVNACYFDIYGNPLYLVGATYLGSFKNINNDGDIMITYDTNFFPTEYGYRNFNIILKCGVASIEISKVVENYSTYTITMEGSSLCQNKNKK